LYKLLKRSDSFR
jgi:hypothetical protein